MQLWVWSVSPAAGVCYWRVADTQCSQHWQLGYYNLSPLSSIIIVIYSQCNSLPQFLVANTTPKPALVLPTLFTRPPVRQHRHCCVQALVQAPQTSRPGDTCPVLKFTANLCSSQKLSLRLQVTALSCQVDLWSGGLVPFLCQQRPLLNVKN